MACVQYVFIIYLKLLREVAAPIWICDLVRFLRNRSPEFVELEGDHQRVAGADWSGRILYFNTKARLPIIESIAVRLKADDARNARQN